MAIVTLFLSVASLPAYDAFRVWRQRRADREAARLAAPYVHFSDLLFDVHRALRAQDPSQVRLAEPKAREVLRTIVPSDGLTQEPSLRIAFMLSLGDAIHDANILLGRYALLQGNVSEARCRLLCAASTPGSPALGDFGPDMTLADELLARGERDAVLQYFTECQRFWRNPDRNRLLEWYTAVEQGCDPDFGTRSGLRAGTNHTRTKSGA